MQACVCVSCVRLQQPCSCIVIVAGLATCSNHSLMQASWQQRYVQLAMTGGRHAPGCNRMQHRSTTSPLALLLTLAWQQLLAQLQHP